MSNAPALVLVGASGVGKNTVAEALLRKREARFSYIRSLCTREPRSTFADEYIYVDEADFLCRIENGEMLEHTRYGDHLYGTPISEVKRVRKEGSLPLMILDINGVESIRRDHPDFPIYAVYLYAAPSEILCRLEKRDLALGDAQAREKIRKRQRSNREDFLALSLGKIRLFDAFVENALLSDCVRAVLQRYRSAEKICGAELEEMQALFSRMSKEEI